MIHPENDTGDDWDIPTIDLTSDKVLDYMGNHISSNNDTGQTSTSCTSAHDTDSTFSPLIILNDVIMNNIPG